MSASAITISRIWLYPIKALGGVEVSSARIKQAGSLHGDREWVIVDEDDKKLWQGDVPKMAMSRCSLDEGGVTVQLPGMPSLFVPHDHGGEGRTISMYGHEFAGIDAGDEPADWLETAFGRPMRLVRIGEGAHLWPGLNPVHVLSIGSLAALNARLAERGEPPVEIERFRPNLLLDSTDLPAFFEEQHAAIRFGDVELRLREPCVRCELPNISRVDGTRLRQPLKLIGAISRERPTAALASFGTYAQLAGGEAISVGAAGSAVRSASAA